jgi:hypothetical protein
MEIARIPSLAHLAARACKLTKVSLDDATDYARSKISAYRGSIRIEPRRLKGLAKRWHAIEYRSVLRDPKSFRVIKKRELYRRLHKKPGLSHMIHHRHHAVTFERGCIITAYIESEGDERWIDWRRVADLTMFICPEGSDRWDEVKMTPCDPTWSECSLGHRFMLGDSDD